MCKKLRCFLEKIYIADKHVTQPPVATVATNSKSAKNHWKTIDANGSYKKKYYHPIVPEKWPLFTSNLSQPAKNSDELWKVKTERQRDRETNNCTNCMKWHTTNDQMIRFKREYGWGGEVIWTKSKRRAVFTRETVS